jgi:hypothetical protein
MLGKEDRPLPAAGRTKIKPLAGERAKEIMSTLGVGTKRTYTAGEIILRRFLLLIPGRVT